MLTIYLLMSLFMSTSADIYISNNLSKHLEDKYVKDTHFSDLILVYIQNLGFSMNKANRI